MVYKKYKKIILFLGMLSPSLNLAAMEDPLKDAAAKLEGLAKQLEERSQRGNRAEEAREERRGREQQAIDIQIQNARRNGADPAIIAALINQKTAILNGQAGENIQLIKNGEYYWKEKAEVTKANTRVLVEQAVADKETERAVKTATITAQKAKEATIESARIWSSKLSDPKVGALIVGTAVGVYAAKQGTQLLAEWWRIPTLAQKTSIKPLGSYFSGESEEPVHLSDLVLEPGLQARVKTLANAITNTVKNSSFFRHMLFHGPAGTGKTMMAMALAHDCGLEYIYFSGSKLEMYSTEEALKQLVGLFEYAKSYPKKLMIIIDEADILCANREGELADKTRKLLNAFLTYTGTECRDYIVVAMTNRFHAFDDAVLSRFGVQLEVGKPALAERKLLLNRYKKKYLDDYRAGQADTRSYFQMLYTKSNERPPLLMEPAVNTDALWNDVAERIAGFVGREISDLCLAIQQAGFESKDRKITQKIVNDTVREQIDQIARKEELRNRRG